MLLSLFLLSASCSPLVSHQGDNRREKPPFDPKLGAVTESGRSVPVAYDVDVVVVGGTSGGVTAAAAAARNGARVFLAAPRPYLGEDICGTYRLWLEPGDQPLSDVAKALFAEPQVARQMQNEIPFSYDVDVASANLHKDSSPPSLLSDGKWHSAASQSNTA